MKRRVICFLLSLILITTSIIIALPKEVTAGETIIKNFDYTGAVQTFTAPQSGEYTFEVWGAQGGTAYNNSSYEGGKGGYSKGTVTLKKGDVLYVYVGGKGMDSGTAYSGEIKTGGYNGGGDGAMSYYKWNEGSTTYGSPCWVGAGGGGSDIRINHDSLYSRVIVAGGGSGGAYKNSSYTSKGYAAGGVTSLGYDASCQAGQTSAGVNGSFGQGASVTGTADYKSVGPGGGGGWYGGGGAKASSTDSNVVKYSGGGSGYVYTSATAANYPSGCLLNSSYYLSNASTIAGDTAFTSPSGSTETGHSGNGYARITYEENKDPILVTRILTTDSNKKYYIFDNTSISQRCDDVATISIENVVPSTLPSGAWDVSKDSNGSVYAWLTVNASDSTKYDLHIAGNGGVIPSSADFLFQGFTNCTQINGLQYLDTSAVTSMRQMFVDCSSMTTFDLRSLDTSNVTDMQMMLLNCSKLTDVNFTNVDTSKVTNMIGMFINCTSLANIPTGLDLSNTAITSTAGYGMMFYECTSLTAVTINSKYIGDSMFYGCNKLTDITIASNVTGVGVNAFKYTGSGKLYTTLNSSSTAITKDNYDWTGDSRTFTPPDNIAPEGTIDIVATYENSGIKYTKNKNVTINLTATDNVSTSANIKVALINENNFSLTNPNSGINWLDFSATKTWTLSSNSGMKTVYVIFKDEAGNQSLYLAQ